MMTLEELFHFRFFSLILADEMATELLEAIDEMLVNGKPAQFTLEERKKLANALIDISNRAKNIALSIS